MKFKYKVNNIDLNYKVLSNLRHEIRFYFQFALFNAKFAYNLINKSQSNFCISFSMLFIFIFKIKRNSKEQKEKEKIKI